MENSKLSPEPIEANVNEQQAKAEKKSRMAKPLRVLIFLMIISVVVNFFVCKSTCDTLQWFDCKLTPWLLAETAISSLLALGSIVAIFRRSTKAVSLTQAYLTAFIVGKVAMIIVSLYADSILETSGIMGTIIGLAVAATYMLWIKASDESCERFPEATRQRSIFGWILVAAFVIVEASSIFISYKAKDDVALFFTSDKVYIEMNVKELDRQSDMHTDFELDGNTLVISIDQRVNVPFGYELTEPTDAEKTAMKREVLNLLTETKEDRYFVSVLVRNNYSVLVKFDINNQIDYDINLSTKQLDEWLK